ncbi:MAG: hypothetical protein JST00_29360 [Deltaproteobacteria bacterium]|nr:hypothetical protein [Deltaproteobacteria bacterium]
MSPLSRFERTSDAPLAYDTYDPNGSGSIVLPPKTGLAALLDRLPKQYVGMSGYLVAGVLLGLILIVTLSLTRGESLPPAAAGAVTDNTVRLHGKDVGDSCWKGGSKSATTKVTVAMEIGLDGKVRRAVASGDSSATMKSCVEAHVKGWEFLPQATATTMVLPFEIDGR